MHRVSTWVVIFVALIVAAILARAYFTGEESGNAGPAEFAGQPEVHLMLIDTLGKRESPASYLGKVVLVNLWATWCPPCRAEMPDLERLYQADRTRGLVVIGIDQGESVATASAFARSLGITYPLLLDKDQQYGRVYAALGLPTSVIVDRTGTIVHGYDGVLTYAQMQSAVAPLLGTKGLP